MDLLSMAFFRLFQNGNFKNQVPFTTCIKIKCKKYKNNAIKIFRRDYLNHLFSTIFYLMVYFINHATYTT